MPWSRPHAFGRLAAAVLGMIVLGATVAACASGGSGTSAHAGGSTTRSSSPTPSPSTPATSRSSSPSTARASTSDTPPPSSSPAPAQHATVRTFVAYDSRGRLAVPVSGHVTGTCFTSSIAAPGAHAYRCITGNRIEDPCFAAPAATSTGSHTLACVDAPWDAAMLLTIRGALPKPMPATANPRPWALQLAGGARCVAATGTVPEVHGVWLDYVCGADSDAAIVPAAGTPTTAQIGSANGGQPLTTVAITVVWRG